MKKLSDIVELINYLRPEKDQLRKDKIFNNKNNHLMDFKKGRNILKTCVMAMCHIIEVQPLLFAKRVDVGEIPPGLILLNVLDVKWTSSEITYDKVAGNVDDA